MPRTLDDLLAETGLLDEASLKQARRHARRARVALVRALTELRLLTDEAICDAIERHLHLQRVDLAGEAIDDEALREVPFELAEARCLLPLSVERGSRGRIIHVVMADPLDVDAVEEIELSTGCELEPLVAPAGLVAEAAQRAYRHIITKMIPRRSGFAPEPHGPITTPIHKVADEAALEVQLEALVELLVERGVIERTQLEEAIRALLKRRTGE